MRIAWLFMMALVVVPLFPPGNRSALAQSERREDYRIDVMVALVDSMPYSDAEGVILRRVDATPHDVILLESGRASGELLASAVFLLTALHQKHGSIPLNDEVLRVRPGTAPAAWRTTETRRAGKIVHRLTDSGVENVPGVGRVRSTNVRLRRYYTTAEEIPRARRP